MWIFALSIPDGYAVALLVSGLTIGGGIASGIGAWVFRSLSSSDRRLTRLEEWREGVEREVDDLKGRR